MSRLPNSSDTKVSHAPEFLLFQHTKPTKTLERTLKSSIPTSFSFFSCYLYKKPSSIIKQIVSVA